MVDPIVYIDTSDIREGQFEALAAAVVDLAEFVRTKNPRILLYRFFLDEDAGRMTVVAVHPDSEALELHMDVGEEEFRKFSHLVDLASIAVYGEVSERLRRRLDRKARMLGEGSVTVYTSHAGFTREVEA